MTEEERQMLMFSTMHEWWRLINDYLMAQDDCNKAKEFDLYPEWVTLKWSLEYKRDRLTERANTG